MPSDLIRGWIPVRVKKTRQNNRLELRSDSIGTEKALVTAAHVAFELVYRRWTTDDIERDGLVRAAAQAANLKAEIAAVRLRRLQAVEKVVSATAPTGG
jgi:hypothetical protein